jgi:hypothetical protein
MITVSDLVFKGIVLASEDTHIVDQYYLLGKYIIEYRVNGVIRRLQWFTN